jgi:hypothetical protein
MSKLKKPEPKIVKELDWNECVDYIEKKHKFQFRDYANMFNNAEGKVNDDVPYLDFWHYLIDAKSISNGCSIDFSNEDLEYVQDGCGETPKDKDLPEQYRGWKQKIIEIILTEFGEGKKRECHFSVWW